MVDQLTLQTIGILFTGISVSLAAFYYINTLRNAERDRQRDQILLRFQSFDLPYMRAWVDVMDRDWKNIDPAELDQETRVNYHYLLSRYQNVGLMLKKKMIDQELIYEILSPRAILSFWEISERGIKEHRERNKFPMYMDAFEYLFKETKKRYPDLSTV